MITLKHLEELDTLRMKGIRQLDTYEIGDLFMSLRSAFKVIEAALDAKATGYDVTDGLDEALKPFQKESAGRDTPKELEK